MKKKASKFQRGVQAKPKARSNHTMPDTLGKVVIQIRSLSRIAQHVLIDTIRPTAKYTRKKGRRAGHFMQPAIPNELLLSLFSRAAIAKAEER